MRTNDLINGLTQDAIVRWRFGRILGFATVCGAIVAGILFLAIGFRPDIAQAVGSVRFLFKFVLTLTLAAAATGTLLRIARPGIPLNRWGWHCCCWQALD